MILKFHWPDNMQKLSKMECSLGWISAIGRQHQVAPIQKPSFGGASANTLALQYTAHLGVPEVHQVRS
jgi:hypothetical protein